MAALTLSLLENMDFFIRVNNLQEITNPIYLQKNIPTTDGLLSYEIFGMSIEDRKTRMAYIDLKGHFMYPLAAKKLKAYDRRLDQILFSTEKYTLTKDGDLVKDDDGNTGPEFLYKIWGKVKVKEKTTLTTKEVETFFNRDKDKLFITKLPVIPAFYRDINDTGTETKSTSEINSTYSSIISYCQNLNSYTDTFTMMKYLTQARIQSQLVNLYDVYVIQNIKGQPSKYGMLKKFMMSKNIDYSARLVISASNLRCGSPETLPIRFGYVGLPLAYVCSCFYPFIIHSMKKFFDNEFIIGGKYPMIDSKGKETYVTVKESYGDEYVSHLVERFIYSPTSRYDKIPIPQNNEGLSGSMAISGRFMKENTTFKRAATVTDLLYIIAAEVVADKHVYVTRYPLDNFNGQFPAKVHILTTLRTTPAMIGENEYTHYPRLEDFGAGRYNSFIDTAQFSNVYTGPMGADYDGDTVSIKPVFTIEANKECADRINSKSYYLDISGRTMRGFTKDFILTAYRLTKTTDTLSDINATKPKITI